VIFGPSKAGKTWLADTAPAPRLFLDAEGKTRFLPSRKRYWNPLTESPPAADGTWDTCIVSVQSYKVLDQAREWLVSGQHPFRSAILDSISEAQQRAVDDVAGVKQMQTQDWGILLRMVSALARNLRDLTTHPTNPLDAVIINAMTKQDDGGVERPFLQGQLADRLPYFYDLCNYLCIVPGPDGQPIRRLIVEPANGFATGEAVGGALGAYIDNPNLTEMLETVRKDIANKTTNTTSDTAKTK
jgi:hypothetical protein